jgi:hypothetical protein
MIIFVGLSIIIVIINVPTVALEAVFFFPTSLIHDNLAKWLLFGFSIGSWLITCLFFIISAITGVYSFYYGGHIEDPVNKKSLALFLAAILCLAAIGIIQMLLLVLVTVIGNFITVVTMISTIISFSVTLLTLIQQWSLLLILGPLNNVIEYSYERVPLSGSGYRNSVSFRDSIRMYGDDDVANRYIDDHQQRLQYYGF